mgnify:CR=1 FL=1
MEQKKALNRKKLKVILVICIVMIVTAGIGLAAYIHHVDTVTLGRKVSVYRLDVSKLTVGEAQQKISEAFQNKTITFHEDGKDVYKCFNGTTGIQSGSGHSEKCTGNIETGEKRDI